MICDLEGQWLPVSVVTMSSELSIQMLNFGDFCPDKPFFSVSEREVRSRYESGYEKSMPMREFVGGGSNAAQIEPAGIILHISRCGSTLISNALREGHDCLVLSEPVILDTLLRLNHTGINGKNAEDYSERVRVIREVINVYAAAFNERVVIKCHTAALLYLPILRAAWKDVPIVILIREPVEVAVSNLIKPADWVRTILDPVGSFNMFGQVSDQVRQMTLEEYTVYGLKRFLTAIQDHFDQRCWLFDYSDLTIRTVRKIAQLFNLQADDEKSTAFEQEMLRYSKDSSKERVFEADREHKWRLASPKVKLLVDELLREEYERLICLSGAPDCIDERVCYGGV